MVFAAHESRSRAASSTASSRAAGLAVGLRRGLALGTGAALVVGLLAGVASRDRGGSTPDPTTLRPAAAATSSPPLRTFSLNVAFPLSKPRARSDMRRAITKLGASVGGFQEISQRPDRDTLLALLRQNNWGWYMPRGVAIPVVFDRDRFRLINGRTVKVHGAQAGVTPSRYINIVRLRERSTGRTFGVVNNHTICCASRDAQLSNMHRIPRLRKHFRMLREELLALRQETEQVVAMGDLNVNYLADRRRKKAGLPTDALGDVVNFDMPLVGSRGKKSLLDYTMTMKGGGLHRTNARIARGFNSDHQSVVITYDVDDAAAPPPPPPPTPTTPPAPLPTFRAGPLTNDPSGNKKATRVVLDQWSRAIAAARPDTRVRVATSRIADAGVTRALLAAADRGVRVQVLVNGGARTAREKELAAALGDGSSSSGSWYRAPGARSHASFLMVQTAGATSGLTLSSSAPVTATATRNLTDAYRATDLETYDAFLAAFQALDTGQAALARRAGGTVGGHLKVRFGPPARRAGDPLARAVRPVRCRGSKSARTPYRHSQVRVAARAWRGRRGVALAQQFARKARQGCRVKVLAGPGVGKWVKRVLRRGGARVRRAPVSQALVIADGHYGRDRDAQRSWTGTDTFNDVSLGRVSQTLTSTSEATLVAYRRQFEGRW